jgi:hypothetical protein
MQVAHRKAEDAFFTFKLWSSSATAEALSLRLNGSQAVMLGLSERVLNRILLET